MRINWTLLAKLRTMAKFDENSKTRKKFAQTLHFAIFLTFTFFFLKKYQNLPFSNHEKFGKGDAHKI
jgi:hypothetical protein